MTLQTITGTELRDLATAIHQGNVDAGWWNDLHTGASILETRNRGEVMMLIMSEGMEAWEGLKRGLMDDHLPHRLMPHVELADKVIRELDLIGAERAEDHFSDSLVMSAVDRCDIEFSVHSAFGTASEELLDQLAFVAKAFEHYRKGRRAEYLDELCASVIATFYVAEHTGIPLLDIIAEKRAYNAQRLDHKREHRLADGGKVI